MSLFFNIENNFENQVIIVVNSNIQITKEIKTNKYIFFVNDNNEIHSLNILKNTDFLESIKKTQKYSLTHLTTNEELRLQKILKRNKINIKLENFTYFTIAKIIKRYNHPKSDKLFLLDLDVNEEKPLTIVTNTLNSLENSIVVIARLGAIMPSGLEIKPNKIMDVESEAMLCSYKSLNLDNTKEGIIILEKQYENQIGKEFDF